MEKEVVVHIYYGILLSYKRNAFDSVLMRWMKLEPITHSSVLAWRIPGTGEPGGLPSVGSHRVQYD